MRRILLATTAALAVVLTGLQGARAADVALTGKVTSVEEGAMEGVVVSATQAGSTIRISVITDAQGEFSFPATKLDPGAYTISASAPLATIWTGQTRPTWRQARPRPPISSSRKRKTSRRSSQMRTG